MLKDRPWGLVISLKAPGSQIQGFLLFVLFKLFFFVLVCYLFLLVLVSYLDCLDLFVCFLLILFLCCLLVLFDWFLFVF